MDGIVFTPGQDEGYVELSASQKGRLFRKHILTKGTLHYPGIKGGKVQIDDAFVDKLVENFRKGTAGIVQVPIVGKDNQHSEDPRDNIGEVVDLEVEGDKVYSIIDVRDDLLAPKVGKTILGASAMMSLNYTDTRSGTKAGPTLLHVAATNRPHVVDLEEFEELAALSADSSNEAVFLTATTEEEETMDLDSLLAELRDNHGIDVAELQKKAEDSDALAKLSGAVQTALEEQGVLKLSADSTASTDDIVAAVTQLAQDRVELTNKVDTLVEERKNEKAEARIDELVSKGFITPEKRDAQLALLLSHPDSFEAILPEKPIVALSAETGIPLSSDEGTTAVDDEIARLSAFAEEQGLTVKA